MRIVVESSDVSEATETALALSHIRDPVTVPYLEKALIERRRVWPYAIPGLARIANAEAIEVLISIMKEQNPESGSSLARFVLYEVKEKIQDFGLKKRIGMALRS
jgi:hypothetical protein